MLKIQKSKVKELSKKSSKRCFNCKNTVVQKRMGGHRNDDMRWLDFEDTLRTLLT